MNLKEAYYQIYEQEQLDEISVETIKSASDQAGRLAGQAAALGAPEYAKKKRSQQDRLYTAQSERRLTPKVKTTKITREETDFFNYVLEYLIVEGYADTNDSAIAIMANMSEEWKEEIIDEANRMENHYDVPNWDKVYARNERDSLNHTRKPERRPSGKLETSNQTTKRVGKQRRQDHVDTRGVKQIPGAKGVGMKFGRAF